MQYTHCVRARVCVSHPRTHTVHKHLRRVLHFFLTCSYVSLLVQDVILHNLASLRCCHSYVIVDHGVIGNIYLNCINLHIEFDNIHVIYLFADYPANL